MTKKERNIEHEITLVISSKNSNDIADSIAGLNSISGYILRPAENKNIYDIYYDTKDHLLMRSKLSLRIRNIEGAWLCTFKGKSSLADSGGIIRKEIELPWSKDNIKTILIQFTIPVMRHHMSTMEGIRYSGLLRINMMAGYRCT